MSPHIEKIMRNSASDRENGWERVTSEEISKELNCNDHNFRTITIGSQSNCNEDGLICDKTTYEKIKTVMNKYNVINYKLSHIHTETLYASQLILQEETYNNFITKLQ